VKREVDVQQAALPDPSLQVTAEQIERRRHARYPVSINAELIEYKSRARVTGRATDLGAGGCYIDALNTFPGGTYVEVFLHCEGQTFHCHALVTYAVTCSGVGMGLAFTRTATDQEISLLDWIKQLGGETSPESRAQAELDAKSGAETESTKSAGLKEVVQELVALLARKQLLTDSEAARFRNQLSK
jgi:hypothetical protein